MSLDVVLYYPINAGNDLVGEMYVVFSANITHNLGKMARECKLYNALWRPEEMDSPRVYAKDIVVDLAVGIALLEANPPYFRQFNPPNGWGDYDALLAFAKQYFSACVRYPNSFIGVNR